MPQVLLLLVLPKKTSVQCGWGSLLQLQYISEVYVGEEEEEESKESRYSLQWWNQRRSHAVRGCRKAK